MRNDRNHRVATAVLAAALASAFCLPALAQQATGPAAAGASQGQPLTQAQVKQLLESRGYTDLDDIDFKKGLWRTEATSADGRHVGVQVNPANGEIITDKAVSEVGKNEIRARLATAGYSKVNDVDLDDGVWKAEARNPQGRKVKVRLSPKDGSIIAVEDD